jgi:hypothetical protein
MPRAISFLVPFVASLVLGIASAEEIKKGDVVVVRTEGAQFVANDKTLLAELPEGAKIEVARVTAAAVGGYATLDGKRVAGWIRLADVELPGAAPDPAPSRTETPQPPMNNPAKSGTAAGKPAPPPQRLVPVELEITPFSAESFGIEGVTGLTRIRDVALSSNGATWFATEAGPIRMADGKAELHDPFGSKASAGQAFAWKDRLWVVSPETGLACYERGKWKTWPAHEKALLKDGAAIAPDGAVWSLGRNCLLRFENGNWEPHLEDVIGKVIFIIVRFGVAADGAVWGAVANTEPMRYKDGKYELLQSKLPSYPWSSFEATPDGRVLVGFDNSNGKEGGLLVVQGEKWQLITTENSQLPTNRVTAVEHAPDGTLWLGFDGHGLARNVGDDWQFFPEEFRHNGWNTIKKIVVMPDGTAWVWGRTLFKATPKPKSKPAAAP